MTLLLTCFEPFGGETINPSKEAAGRIPDSYKDWMIRKIVLPVSKNRSVEEMKKAVALYKPSFILSLGQAGGRKTITVERRGVNVDDFRIPDNDGVTVSNQKIVPDGPDELLSNLPVGKIVSDMNREGVPCAVSESAGKYICNHVLYSNLYLTKDLNPEVQVGFIHVPFLPEQVKKPGVPSMELSTVVRGIESAVRTIYKEVER